MRLKPNRNTILRIAPCSNKKMITSSILLAISTKFENLSIGSKIPYGFNLPVYEKQPL